MTAGRRGPAAAPRVLLVTGGFVVADKPPGLPTEPDRAGPRSAVRDVEGALGLPSGALHAVTRLDLPVSGVLLLAHGEEARREAVRAREERRLARTYLALAAGAPAPAKGEWDAAIGMDGKGRPVAGGRAARAARTRYEVLAVSPAGAALLRLEPVTGRSHQLRIHTGLAGAPLLGDPLHGGPRRVVTPGGAVVGVPRVALHALRVTLRAPSGAALVDAVAEPPADLAEAWRALGGAPEALTALVVAAG